MSQIPEIFETKGKMAVPINGVAIGFDNVKFSLQRFSRPLLFHNADSAFEVSVSGTCGLVRQQGENFLIATRHQLGKPPSRRHESEVCIALYDESNSGKPTLLTPNGGVIHSVSELGEKFLEDVLILTFTRDDSKLEQLNAQFLQVDGVKCLEEVDAADIVQFLTIAFPSMGVTLAFTDDAMGYEEVKSGFVRLALERLDVETLEKHVAFRVKETVPKQRDWDGYSGAPVYFVYIGSDGLLHLGWAGVIRLAGNGILHALLASEIRNYIRLSRE